MNERDCRGSGLIPDTSRWAIVSKDRNRRRSCAALWLGRASREHQEHIEPRGAYPHSTFCCHSTALRKPIALFHSRNLPLPPENRYPPHVCQIVALSENTGYRFADWLRMFGFDLRQIPRLQMRLHPERTVLVTPVDDDSAGFLWRPSLDCEGSWSSSTAPPQGEWDVRRRYLFAKIGSGDATACPELLPGTMVRVDRYYAQRIRGIHRDAMGRSCGWSNSPMG